MGTFWNKERIEKYEVATNLLNYPEVPLKNYFQEIIHRDDTVLEIGSGPGVVSFYLAPMCRQLTAVDNDLYACEHIRKRVSEKGITNIEIVYGEWPNEQLKPCDVTISLYVYKAFKSVDKVRELLKSTKRVGLIMITQPGVKGGFPIPLSKHLGLNLNEQNSYHDGLTTAKLLKEEGVKVRCDTVKHEFGQPVQNLDDATSFMMRQLKLDESLRPRVQAAAPDLVETRKGRLYVPFERTNDVIIFEK